MITIGIDPGAEAGLAAVSGSEIVHVRDVRKLGEHDPWARIGALQSAASACGLRLTAGGRLWAERHGYWIAVEAQFQGTAVDKRSALKVAGHAAVWEACGLCVGGSAVRILPRVYPSQWQAMIGAAKGPSKVRKARAREVLLSHRPDLEHLRQGAVDAVWIAIYAHGIRLGWDGKRGTIPGWEWVAEAKG